MRIIDDILRDGELDRFIGMEECLTFEAKGAPAYDLNVQSHRFELLKDVSAMANAEGGYLIIGLSTDKKDDKITDFVCALDLVKRDHYKAANGIITGGIYPKISGISCNWVLKKNSVDEGVFVVTIPPQDTDRKYFFILGASNDGESLPGFLFGVAIRTGSDNLPMSNEELYRRIKGGEESQRSKLERIEAKVDRLLAVEEGMSVTTTISEKVHLLSG